MITQLSEQQERVQITRGILIHSSLWKELTASLDVLSLAEKGPIDFSGWTEADHAEVDDWACGSRAMLPLLTFPKVLKEYFRGVKRNADV